jgi:hypothetical protein
MLKIKTMPVLLRIASKIDINPAIEALKKLDIFKDAATAPAAVKQLDRENVGIVATEIISAFIPQLDNFADDIPALVASYKDISIEEANEIDATEFVNEVINDDGIIYFFKRALARRTERRQ